MQLGDADVHVCFSASLADGHGLGDGRWLCLAGVADWAKGTITLYIDGWPQTSGPVCDYDIGLAEHLALYLGRAAHAGDFHHGNLDEVRIYDRALSFEEVRELCAAVPVPVLPGSWGRVKGMHRR